MTWIVRKPNNIPAQPHIHTRSNVCLCKIHNHPPQQLAYTVCLAVEQGQVAATAAILSAVTIAAAPAAQAAQEAFQLAEVRCLSSYTCCWANLTGRSQQRIYITWLQCPSSRSFGQASVHKRILHASGHSPPLIRGVSLSVHTDFAWFTLLCHLGIAFTFLKETKISHSFLVESLIAGGATHCSTWMERNCSCIQLLFGTCCLGQKWNVELAFARQMTARA